MPFIPVAPLADQEGNSTPIWLNWFNAVFRLLSRSPTIFTGILAPTITPDKIGDMFIDTNAKKIYIAVGVGSSADWEILN